MRTIRFGTVLVTATLGAALGGAACSSAPGEDVSATEAAALAKCGTWEQQQADRQAAFDGYLAANNAAFESFKNASLGTSGVPMVMLRLFPVIFPDFWGTPADNFAAVGFAKDPYEPNRPLPLGLGYAPSSPAIPVPTPGGVVDVNVNVVSLTCMGCHGGRVQGADGVVHTVPGAPNTQFNGFRTAVYLTVNDPRYTVENFLAALNAQPAGWLYNNDPAMAMQEALERAIFAQGAAQFLGQLQAGSNFFAARFQQTLGTYTYGLTPNAPNPSGPTPGYLDAIGAGITIVVDPTKMAAADVQAALPPKPAMIDIMSVWTESKRPAAQWDGSIVDHLHRNLAAEFGVVGDPTKLNMANADLTTPFTDALPSPVYPFKVDLRKAALGEKLFGRYCASCHTGSETGANVADGNGSIFPVLAVPGSNPSADTDSNRALIWSTYSVGALRAVLTAACTNPKTCAPNGTPVPPENIVNPTGGYMALPLNGIWARAPYLHNGSVPTLEALLVPGDRPTTFYRGNIAYDQANVGFVSATAVTPLAAIYDTTKSGNSNVGHASAAFLGDVDWQKKTHLREALLEYLKTL